MTTTLDQLLPLVIGVTKKDIAIQLDEYSPLHNFSAEVGLTSYHHYTRNELLELCIRFRVDPVSAYTKNRKTEEWQAAYFMVNPLFNS